MSTTNPTTTPDPATEAEVEVVTPMEPVPDPVDDAVVEPEAYTPEPAADAVEEEPAEPTIVEGNANKRSQIAEMYRAQRDNPPEPDAEVVDEDVDPEPEPEPESLTSEAVEQGDPETFELKIDGEIKQLSKDEVIALAQKNGAVDNRLTEVNRRLDELKAQQVARPVDQTRTPAPEDQPGAAQNEPEPDGSEQDQTTILSDEELGDIAERIQVGDQDDAKGAMRTLVDTIATRVMERTEARAETVASNAIVQQKQQSDIDTVIDDFTERYSDIVNDPLIAPAGVVATTEEMKVDLRKIGMNDEQMAKLGDNAEVIAAAHSQMRASGREVRSLSEVLAAGGDKIRERFNLPVPGDPDPTPADPTPDPVAQPKPKPAEAATETEKRIVRKQSATKQPSTTTGREQPRPSKQRPKTAAEIVADKRAQRGFAAIS